MKYHEMQSNQRKRPYKKHHAKSNHDVIRIKLKGTVQMGHFGRHFRHSHDNNRGVTIRQQRVQFLSYGFTAIAVVTKTRFKRNLDLRE